MKIDVISIFPTYLDPLSLSLVGKAVDTGLVDLGVHDLRMWTHDRHRTVDDTPYGGGAGMVMRPEPWGEALDAVSTESTRLVVLTPSGRPFTQGLAYELAAEPHLVLACGRYEGIDARVVEHARDTFRVDEVSIGDYVLNGGEAAALVIIEAVVRLLPGVIGNPASLAEESHSADQDGLLEYPVYTKPPSWRGHDVPEILFSGHHGKIAGWRREQSVARTRARRPDLLPPALRRAQEALGVELVVEPARPADAGELLTLQRAAYVPEGRRHASFEIPPLTETLAELIQALTTDTVLVARLGTRIVGSVRGAVEPDQTWYVGRLAVTPDHQGGGIGGRLLSEIEALAPSDTVRFRLTTGANSTTNLVFYARRGYRETGRISPPGDVTMVTMTKPVPAA